MTSTVNPETGQREGIFEPVLLINGDELAIDSTGHPFINVRGRLYQVRIYTIALNLDRINIVAAEHGLSDNPESLNKYRNLYPFSRAISQSALVEMSSGPLVTGWPLASVGTMSVEAFRTLKAGGSLYRSMLSNTEWQCNDSIHSNIRVGSFTTDFPSESDLIARVRA